MYHALLAQRGLFVEPTSATVAVTLDKLGHLFKEDELIVAVLTGHGLKHPPQGEWEVQHLS